MKSLSITELKWIESALQFTADACAKEAKELDGMLQSIAVLNEQNYRATAYKVVGLIEQKAKRIEIM